MLAEAGDGLSYEARREWREAMDLALEAPEVDPQDEDSVRDRVAFERDRRRQSASAIEQQRRQDAALDDVTF